LSNPVVNNSLLANEQTPKQCKFLFTTIFEKLQIKQTGGNINKARQLREQQSKGKQIDCKATVKEQKQQKKQKRHQKKQCTTERLKR